MALTRRPVALVLRALGLGDLLAGVPALRALRGALPAHRLVLATDPSLAPLVHLVGGVDRLLPARGLRLPPAGEGSIDVAVNLHGKGPQSHRLLQRLSPTRLVAFARDDLGVPGPGWRPDEHESMRWARLVAAELAVAADPRDGRLPSPPRPPGVGDAVVIHPGAGSAARRWPAARFAVVAHEIRTLGHRVVITGSGSERALAGEIAAAAGIPPEQVLAGRTSTARLAAEVAHARLVVSGDTGVAHLATAFATPSVTLFGPVPPAQWGPLTDGPHRCLWGATAAGYRGDPHGQRPDHALERIQPAEVLEAATSLLARNQSMVR